MVKFQPSKLAMRVRSPLPAPIKSGIYFLIQNNRIVYVGQSTNVGSRINTHITTNKLSFDAAVWFEVPLNELADVEHFWIWLLRPPYNVGGKFKTTDKLASALRQVLADEELKRVEEIERQTLSLIADFLKRTFDKLEKACPPTLIEEISKIRQQMFDWLLSGKVPPSMAHKIVARFFGWSLWETSTDHRPKNWFRYALPTAPEQPPALLAEIDAEISSPNPGA
jgi:GIY-YIG catalytic domain-containing protein